MTIFGKQLETSFSVSQRGASSGVAQNYTLLGAALGAERLRRFVWMVFLLSVCYAALEPSLRSA